ncbi:hypothetical protein R3W88_016110 [Solanum pinnatisectum]|uniref:Uncharacterized protein n=1 Tax=Solanum pinnatisectum TaxID=50273 RepID=A0AAV9KWH5_9SOLN|nr:hypothetical protein R3W88_016110 [Solanum pinnatisectum]
MHLGWFFLNDNSHMGTKSLDTHFDTIVSNILTFCDLWLNLESNKKTFHNEEIENLWIDGFLSLSTWDMIGNKKAIMLRMRMYDHMTYLVNCHNITHLEVINYQISSSYFILRNKGDLKGKECTQFPSHSFSTSSLGKTSSTSFGQNMENEGNQLFMNMSPTVEVTTPFGKNEQPFAVINSSEQTYKCCGNGFNLGVEGGKMSKRITAKDHLKSEQHCESIADGSRSRSQ